MPGHQRGTGSAATFRQPDQSRSSGMALLFGIDSGWQTGKLAGEILQVSPVPRSWPKVDDNAKSDWITADAGKVTTTNGR